MKETFGEFIRRIRTENVLQLAEQKVKYLKETFAKQGDMNFKG